MDRTGLAKYVAKRAGLSDRQAQEAVTAVLDGVLHGLWEDGRVVISSFGTWRLKQFPQCVRRNPQTGEPVIVPARKALRFTVADRLREAVKTSEQPASSKKRSKGTLS